MSLGAVARRNPEGTALIDAGTPLTFAKLFDKSEAIASALELERDMDVPRAFVAVNDTTTIALIFALLERGIPALPLNPRWTDIERRQMVARARAQWVVPPTSPHRFDQIWVGANATPPIDRSGLFTTPRKTQLLIATSGSSGAPKLVCLSQRALEAAADASIAHLSMSAHDRWLLSLNLAHIGGISVLLRCLRSESCVVLAEPRMPAEAMLHRIAQTQVTLASLVPTQLERLLSIESPRGGIESLRAVLLGGAHAPKRLVERARAAGWPLLLTYGLSEAGSQVCTQPLTDLTTSAAHDDAGVPLPGIEVKLEHDVICIRGASLFDGYHAESASPFDAEGWFHTGDFGSMTETGRLVPLGRRDDCIVTGGEKVSALEVESAILDQPWVRAAVVVALANSTWGQIVAAAVVLDQAADCARAIERTNSALATRLAPHKRPRRWLALAELPLLPDGKLDRPAVRALFEKP
jgi:o-succinylbenzoate---CoA ligase